MKETLNYTLATIQRLDYDAKTENETRFSFSVSTSVSKIPKGIFISSCCSRLTDWFCC